MKHPQTPNPKPKTRRDEIDSDKKKKKKMGKFPTSFRSAVGSAQLKLSSPLVQAESQSPIPNNRPSKSRPSARTTRKPNDSTEPTKSPAPFKSPNLSDAKNLFNTIITTARSPLDQRFHNSLLQSYASISTINDSISLLRHMSKTHPSFSPDRSTYHILLIQSCKASNSSLAPVQQIILIPRMKSQLFCNGFGFWVLDFELFVVVIVIG
ncbi:hypothetical protein CsatA_002785 [Cannabis sativa]